MSVPFEYLWLPAIFVTLFGAWVLLKVVKLSRWSALLLGLLKAAIPFFYFAYYYDGSWNLLDDVTYFRAGDLLLAEGENPFLILFSSFGWERLMAIAGGQHFLYYWWNLLAVYLFGPFYSSPVFLNVATTFISGALMFKIGRTAGFNEKYAKWLSVFFLFHWDVLSWSSFVNLKDILVLMLTLAAIYPGIRFVQTRKIRYAVTLAGVVLVLLGIRFYIPVLLLVCLAAWTVFVVKGFKKVPLIILALAGVLIVFPPGAFQTFSEMRTGEWLMGPFRMLLTPQPWSIVPEYSFLLIPSICHWVLFVPGLVAGMFLLRKNPAFRFAAIYFAAIISFYGLIPELQGPRHRVQVTWVLVWAQFDLVWLLRSGVVRRTSAVGNLGQKVRAGAPLGQRT